MACSPVIAITGGQDDLPRYRHAYQNAEDFEAWRGVTKANFTVDTVERLPDLLRQAFRTATSGSPGPGAPRAARQRRADARPRGRVRRVLEERFQQYPAFRPEPEIDAIDAAADALAKASRPIIVAGGGVIASGAGPEVVKLAERLNIPVATSLNAKEIIPDSHPLAVGVPGSYSRWCANQAVSEADLVFFIGSHTGGQVTNVWQLPKIGTPVIQLDIALDELGRNYPNTRLAAGRRQGDAAEADRRRSSPSRRGRSGWRACRSSSPTTGPRATRTCTPTPCRSARSASARS